MTLNHADQRSTLWTARAKRELNTLGSHATPDEIRQAIERGLAPIMPEPMEPGSVLRFKVDGKWVVAVRNDDDDEPWSKDDNGATGTWASYRQLVEEYGEPELMTPLGGDKPVITGELINHVATAIELVRPRMYWSMSSRDLATTVLNKLADLEIVGFDA